VAEGVLGVWGTEVPQRGPRAEPRWGGNLNFIFMKRRNAVFRIYYMPCASVHSCLCDAFSKVSKSITLTQLHQPAPDAGCCNVVSELQVVGQGWRVTHTTHAHGKCRLLAVVGDRYDHHCAVLVYKLTRTSSVCQTTDNAPPPGTHVPHPLPTPSAFLAGSVRISLVASGRAGGPDPWNLPGQLCPWTK